MCKDTAAGQILCENVIGMIMGYRSDQMNSTILPVIFGHLVSISVIFGHL